MSILICTGYSQFPIVSDTDHIWNLNFKLSKIFQTKFIALPGYFCKVEFEIDTKYKIEDDVLIISEIPDQFRYQAFENLVYKKRLAHRFKEFKLYTNGRISKTYYIFHYSLSVQKLSWYDATDICREINASLPSLQTKEIMMDFLKLIGNAPTHLNIFLIPINLKYNSSMVSIL